MIAFTICSNNYLPMARVLGESLLEHNPSVRFIIGLVDEPHHTIDYSSFAPCEVLPVGQLGIPELDEMALRYSIVELNTSVKPFYFKHLFKQYSEIKDLAIYYFDPDIEVYADLGEVTDSLRTSAVVLTPHALTPIALDSQHPNEHSLLNFGVYNLGFCAMRRSHSADGLLDWWSERLTQNCRIDVANGMFVDQLWMNLAPIFFEGVKISRHPGLNVAYWNLHERQLEFRDGIWKVNQHWPLVFYHFSDLPLADSDTITKTPTRYSLRDRPELAPLLKEYRAKLAAYDPLRFRSIPCVFSERRSRWWREQQQMYYRRHPLQLLATLARRAFPRQLSSFIRASGARGLRT